MHETIHNTREFPCLADGKVKRCERCGVGHIKRLCAAPPTHLDVLVLEDAGAEGAVLAVAKDL
jgi:hypothetical protein